MSIDTKIQAEVEGLRAQVQDTQDLYREVCALLFFRHGITPTANKLYQLVRKGSMSAPAQALSRFWEDLREKSRVRIEHPDLPEALRSTAGELIGQLWRESQAAAAENYSELRIEAEEQVKKAEIAKKEADDRRETAIAEQRRLGEQLQSVTASNLELERRLAGTKAEADELRRQLLSAGQQQLALETELSAARKDFASELEKLRDALQRSEDRCEATEKRALLEIDRERTASARVRKDLTQAQKNNQEQAERHQRAAQEFQRELGDLRQKLGVAEGGLQRLQEVITQQASRIDQARQESAQANAREALLRRELELRDERLQNLEAMLQATKQAIPQERNATLLRLRRRRSAMTTTTAAADAEDGTSTGNP